jgi:hypothetical protein
VSAPDALFAVVDGDGTYLLAHASRDAAERARRVLIDAGQVHAPCIVAYRPVLGGVALRDGSWLELTTAADGGVAWIWAPEVAP